MELDIEVSPPSQDNVWNCTLTQCGNLMPHPLNDLMSTDFWSSLNFGQVTNGHKESVAQQQNLHAHRWAKKEKKICITTSPYQKLLLDRLKQPWLARELTIYSLESTDFGKTPKSKEQLKGCTQGITTYHAGCSTLVPSNLLSCKKVHTPIHGNHNTAVLLYSFAWESALSSV